MIKLHCKLLCFVIVITDAFVPWCENLSTRRSEWGDKKSICNKFQQTSPLVGIVWPTHHQHELLFGLMDGKVKVGFMSLPFGFLKQFVYCSIALLILTSMRESERDDIVNETHFTLDHSLHLICKRRPGFEQGYGTSATACYWKWSLVGKCEGRWTQGRGVIVFC